MPMPSDGIEQAGRQDEIDALGDGELALEDELHGSILPPFPSQSTAAMTLLGKLQDKAKQKLHAQLGDLSLGQQQERGGGAPPPPSSSAAAPDTPPTPRQLYTFRQQHGVNLGSLFTLEAWLTPSLFANAAEGEGKQGKSELEVVKGNGADKAKQILEHHWDHFVDDGDWRWFTAHGVDTIRLPVSYYHVLPGLGAGAGNSLMKGTPYEPYAGVYADCLPRIHALFDTAARHGVGVLLDLHGCVGPQNDQHHSGVSTSFPGLWKADNAEKLQQQAIDILVVLAREFADRHENMVGIELLNEPANGPWLAKFYERTLKAFDKAGVRPDLPVIISDGWATPFYSNWLNDGAAKVTRRHVIIDYHLYRCFTDKDRGIAIEDHANGLELGCNSDLSDRGQTASWLEQMSKQAHRNILVGEWSAAMGGGSFDCSALHKDGHHARRAGRTRWATNQLQAFEEFTGGSFFWTAKKEGKPDAAWCFYGAIEGGCLPENIDPNASLVGAWDAAAAEQYGKEEQERAWEGHKSYWSSRGGDGTHARFRQGFAQGWADATAFFGADLGGRRGSVIGYSDRWIQERLGALKHAEGDPKDAWEYEEAMKQALRAWRRMLQEKRQK
ncbi:Glucan 1,3-beta-glucosidase 3 [Tilletia horrida]|nr:Glucan 1,3-beta-glucosidase 3 [Tilletia horrida]